MFVFCSARKMHEIQLLLGLVVTVLMWAHGAGVNTTREMWTGVSNGVAGDALHAPDVPNIYRRLFVSSNYSANYNPNDWRFNPHPGTGGYLYIPKVRDTCDGRRCRRIYLLSSLGSGRGATEMELDADSLELMGYTTVISVETNVKLDFHGSGGGRRRRLSEYGQGRGHDGYEEEDGDAFGVSDYYDDYGYDDGTRRLKAGTYTYTDVDAPEGNDLSFKNFHYNDLSYLNYDGPTVEKATRLVSVLGITYISERYVNATLNPALDISSEPDPGPEQFATDYIRADIPIYRNSMYHQHSAGGDDVHLLMSDQPNGELLALAPSHLMPCSLTHEEDSNSYRVDNTSEVQFGVTFVNTIVSRETVSIKPDTDYRYGADSVVPCLLVKAGLTSKQGVEGYPWHDHHCQLAGHHGYTLFSDEFCTEAYRIGSFKVTGSGEGGALTDHAICQIQGLDVNPPDSFPAGYFPYYTWRKSNFFVTNFGALNHFLTPFRPTPGNDATAHSTTDDAIPTPEPAPAPTNRYGFAIACNGLDFVSGDTAEIEEPEPYNIWLDNPEFRWGIIISIVVVIVIGILTDLHSKTKHKEGDVVVYRLEATFDQNALERLLGSDVYDFFDLTRHKHHQKFKHWFPEDKVGKSTGLVSPVPDKRKGKGTIHGEGKGTGDGSGSDSDTLGSGDETYGPDAALDKKSSSKKLVDRDQGEDLVDEEMGEEQKARSNQHHSEDYHQYHVNYILSYAVHYVIYTLKYLLMRFKICFWRVYAYVPPLWLMKTLAVAFYRVVLGVWRLAKKLWAVLRTVVKCLSWLPGGKTAKRMYKSSMGRLMGRQRKKKNEDSAIGVDDGTHNKVKYGLAVIVKDHSNGLLMLHPLCKLANYKYNKEMFSEELEECLELLDYKSSLSRHRSFKLAEEREKRKQQLRRRGSDMPSGLTGSAGNTIEEASSESDHFDDVGAGAPKAKLFHKTVADLDELLDQAVGGGATSGARAMAGSSTHNANDKKGKNLWAGLKSRMSIAQGDDEGDGDGSSKLKALFDPDRLRKMVAEQGASALNQQWALDGDADQPHFKWAFVEEEGHEILSLRHHRIIKTLSSTVQCKVRRNRGSRGKDDDISKEEEGALPPLAVPGGAGMGRSRGSMVVNSIVQKDMKRRGPSNRATIQSGQLPGLAPKPDPQEAIDKFGLEKMEYNFLKQSKRSEGMLSRISMAVAGMGKKKKKTMSPSAHDLEAGQLGMEEMRKSELVDMQEGATPGSRKAYSKMTAMGLLSKNGVGTGGGGGNGDAVLTISEKRDRATEYDPFPREVVIDALPPEDQALWAMKLSMGEMQTLYNCRAEATSEDHLKYSLIELASRGDAAGGDSDSSDEDIDDIDYLPPPPSSVLRQRKKKETEMSHKGTVNPMYETAFHDIDAVGSLLNQEQNAFLKGSNSRPQYALARLKTQRRIIAEQKRKLEMQLAAGLEVDEHEDPIFKEIQAESPIVDWTYIKSFWYSALSLMGLDFHPRGLRGKECYQRIRDRASDWETESLLRMVQPREHEETTGPRNAYEAQIHDYTLSRKDGASFSGGLNKINRCYFVRDPIDWRRIQLRYSTTVTEYQLLEKPPVNNIPHPHPPLLKCINACDEAWHVSSVAFAVFFAAAWVQLKRLWTYARSGDLAKDVRILFFGKSVTDLQREKEAQIEEEEAKAKREYAKLQSELAVKGDLRGMARSLSMQINLKEDMETTKRVLSMFQRPKISKAQSKWQQAAAAVNKRDKELKDRAEAEQADKHEGEEDDGQSGLRENFSGKSMWKKAFFRTKLAVSMTKPKKDNNLTPTALRAAVKLKRQEGGAMKRVKYVKAKSSSTLLESAGSGRAGPTAPLPPADSPRGLIASKAVSMGDMSALLAGGGKPMSKSMLSIDISSPSPVPKKPVSIGAGAGAGAGAGDGAGAGAGADAGAGASVGLSPPPVAAANPFARRLSVDMVSPQTPITPQLHTPVTTAPSTSADAAVTRIAVQLGSPDTPVVDPASRSADNTETSAADLHAALLATPADSATKTPMKKFESAEEQRRAERFARVLSKRGGDLGGSAGAAGTSPARSTNKLRSIVNRSIIKKGFVSRVQPPKAAEGKGNN